MKKIIVNMVRFYLNRCTVCGCSDMDCWGRCSRCGSDMKD